MSSAGRWAGRHVGGFTLDAIGHFTNGGRCIAAVWFVIPAEDLQYVTIRHAVRLAQGDIGLSVGRGAHWYASAPAQMMAALYKARSHPWPRTAARLGGGGADGANLADWVKRRRPLSPSPTSLGPKPWRATTPCWKDRPWHPTLVREEASDMPHPPN